jgi:uncharacterized protein YqgQ
VKPKKQKLCKMSEEKIEVVKAEVQHLLDAGFIREVTYRQWLANVVMVRKNKNGKCAWTLLILTNVVPRMTSLSPESTK